MPGTGERAAAPGGPGTRGGSHPDADPDHVLTATRRCPGPRSPPHPVDGPAREPVPGCPSPERERPSRLTGPGRRFTAPRRHSGPGRLLASAATGCLARPGGSPRRVNVSCA